MVCILFWHINEPEEFPEVAGTLDNQEQADLWIKLHQELYPNKFKYHVTDLWVIPR